MSIYKEGAATGKHQLDGPPRQNSSRCGMNHNSAGALNQSLSGALPIVKTKSGGKMNQEVALHQDFSAIEQVVIQGDLEKLTAEQRVTYYNRLCESCGLNPMTTPFSYLRLSGKLTLYAKKDCTEQLRKIHGVSIEGLDGRIIDDVYVVTAKARDKTGRIDQATGAVVMGNLRGEAKANMIMKAETKAKRRVTLSICGMGFTDESEVESIPNAQFVDVDYNTGEVKNLVVESPKTLAAPAVVEPAKITDKQAAELKAILSECDDEYQNWFYSFVKRQYKTDDLSGIISEKFEGALAAVRSNLEDHYAKLCADAQPQLLAAGAR
jgi:hypothetical protein